MATPPHGTGPSLTFHFHARSRNSRWC
jgi:hypothetical protein